MPFYLTAAQGPNCRRTFRLHHRGGHLQRGFRPRQSDRLVRHRSTSHNIMTNDVLYRAGFTADLLTIVAAIINSVLLYQLLNPLDRTLALVALAFDLISNTNEVVNLPNHFAPPQILMLTPALPA